LCRGTASRREPSSRISAGKQTNGKTGPFSGPFSPSNRTSSCLSVFFSGPYGLFFRCSIRSANHPSVYVRNMQSLQCLRMAVDL
jgi:hypothetical protein